MRKANKSLAVRAHQVATAVHYILHVQGNEFREKRYAKTLGLKRKTIQTWIKSNTEFIEEILEQQHELQKIGITL